MPRRDRLRHPCAVAFYQTTDFIMKKTLLFALLTLSLSVFAADKAPKNALFSSPAIIWAGVDYSHARLIGPGEFSSAIRYEQPVALKPDWIVQGWDRFSNVNRMSVPLVR